MVASLAHLRAPATDGGHLESGPIGIVADRTQSVVSHQVVDPIGDGPGHLPIDEVLCTHPFLLLGIDGDDRSTGADMTTAVSSMGWNSVSRSVCSAPSLCLAVQRRL
jgi:hypothetical protein